MASMGWRPEAADLLEQILANYTATQALRPLAPHVNLVIQRDGDHLDAYPREKGVFQLSSAKTGFPPLLLHQRSRGLSNECSSLSVLENGPRDSGTQASILNERHLLLPLRWYGRIIRSRDSSLFPTTHTVSKLDADR